MSHVDAAANEAKEVPLASQSAVAGKASAEAGTLARQPAPAVADLGTGEMTKAMALRDKYRLTTDLGAMKRRLPLAVLGVHPENRGSMYPGADVVRGLGIQLAREGFSQEDRQQDTHATTPAVAGAADPPIEEEVEEDEPDPRYHKDNIQAHLGETFVGFEFERPVLPEGYIWAPGNEQGQYILIKEEITAELYGDRQQGTHATTPAVAGAADPPTEEDVEEDEPDARYYKDNIQVPWKT